MKFLQLVQGTCLDFGYVGRCCLVCFNLVWFTSAWIHFAWYNLVRFGLVWRRLDGTHTQKNKQTNKHKKKHDDMLSCCATKNQDAVCVEVYYV